MSEKTGTEGNDLSPDDLDLVDDSLEDAGKSDEDHWNELADAESGAAAEGTDLDTPAEEPANGADDDAAAAASADDDAGKGASDDEPGDGVGDDPFANATEEQRAAFDAAQAEIQKLKHSDRSQRGRLSVLTRRIDELVQQSQSRPAADSPDGGAAAGDDKGSGKDGDSAAQRYFKSEKWANFQKEYPEVSGPIQEIIDPLLEKIDSQDQQLSAITEKGRQDTLSEQETLLAEQHSDWQTVTAEEEFVAWLGEQPRYVQEAVYRNADSIVDAEEAGDVITRFKAFRSENANGDTPGRSDTPDNGGADGGADQGNGTKRLPGRRRRQLESAAGQPSRSGGRASSAGIPEDGDEKAIWDAFEKEERRQAARG